MRTKILGAILFLSGALVLFIPRFILPVCEFQGFAPMTCSHTGTAEMFMGGVMATASLGIFFSKATEAARWPALSALAAGLSVLLIPDAIGYCHSTRMPCNYGTVPALRLVGGVITLASLSAFLLSLKKERK